MPMEENQLSQAEVIIKLGEEYLKENYFDLAIDAYSRAMDLEPTNIYTYCLRGIASGKAGRFEESIADFSVYIAGSNGSEVGFEYRGLSCLR
jgi:lipoprotein NlpI